MCSSDLPRGWPRPLEEPAPPPVLGASTETPIHGAVYETAIGNHRFWMQYVKPNESYAWNIGDWHAGLFVSPVPVDEAPAGHVCTRWAELQRSAYLVHVWWTSVAAHLKAGTLRPLAVCPVADQAQRLYGRYVDVKTGDDGRVVGWTLHDMGTDRETELDHLSEYDQRHCPRNGWWYVPQVRAALACGYRPEIDGPVIGSRPFQMPEDVSTWMQQEYERIDLPYSVVAVHGRPFGPDEVTCTEFLYFTTEADVVAFVRAVANPDWYILAERMGERTYSVKIRFRFYLDKEAFLDLQELEQELERIARQHNGEYDGNEIGPIP